MPRAKRSHSARIASVFDSTKSASRIRRPVVLASAARARDRGLHAGSATWGVYPFGGKTPRSPFGGVDAADAVADEVMKAGETRKRGGVDYLRSGSARLTRDRHTSTAPRYTSVYRSKRR